MVKAERYRQLRPLDKSRCRLVYEQNWPSREVALRFQNILRSKAADEESISASPNSGPMAAAVLLGAYQITGGRVS